jgi:hypothetical protein
MQVKLIYIFGVFPLLICLAKHLCGVNTKLNVGRWNLAYFSAEG